MADEEYVLSRANDEDISTCVGFQALAKANTKFSVGLRYTGVNLTICGRSEMIFLLGVGNLQKGERYANMDYVFGSTLQFVLALLVLISYDICCQWFVNLFKRIDTHWPAEIKPRAGTQLIPAIPKLHEPMHQQTNHQLFSLNYIPGVSLSDCECPERVWSPHNYLANGTKTQGPGSRQDVLDDHFGFWNWSKYIHQGKTLLRRYRSAVADRNLQAEGHRGLVDSIDGEVLKAWERMCVEWEKEGFPKTKKNPYHAEGVLISEAQAKKELEDEEEAYRKQGGTFPHETTAMGFICMGLELEETQRHLQRTVKAAGSTPTSKKEGSLKEQRSSLLVGIRAWQNLLPIYVPGLLQYQADHPAETPSSSNPEDAILWLPSRLPQPDHERVCATGLSEIEEKMRLAQCSDALDSIRKILTIKTQMVQFKNKNLREQRDGTRSRAVIDRVHKRARLAAEKYRTARAAKLSLAGPGEWEERFKVLQDGDIRGFQDAAKLRPRKGRKGIWEDGQGPQEVEPEPSNEESSEFELFNEIRSRRDGTGETRRTLSWIWVSPKPKPKETPEASTGLAEGEPCTGEKEGEEEEEEEVGIEKGDEDELFRVEWAKSRARTMRAREEVMLLKEEMRRVLAFLGWKANWWKERAQARSDISRALAEGLAAYAASQAANQESLAVHFRLLWASPLQEAHESSTTDKEEDDDDPDDDDGDDDEYEGENLDGGGFFDPDDMEEDS